MYRKYLAVSKNVHMVLSVLSQHPKTTIKDKVEHLVETGLRYDRIAHLMLENVKIFDQRLPEFQYAVSKQNRTYLAVSPQVYEKVKSYANTKGLKIVEATWRLISIGTQYMFNGEPENDPRYEVVTNITKQIIDNLKRRYGLPFEKYLEAAGPNYLHDRVVETLQYQSMRTKTRRPYPRRRGIDSALNVLNVMETTYMTMLLGAQKIMDELENKIEALANKLEQTDKQQKQRTNKFKDKRGILDTTNEDN